MSARCAALVTSALLAGAAPGILPSAGLAHGGRSHQSEDSAPHRAADEPALSSFTSRATARDAATALAAVAAPAQDVGSWGPVTAWPVVGVHVALLPNGKVLAHDSVGDKAAESYAVHDHTRATVWDPVTGTQTPVDVHTGFNVFCSGLAHLTNGSLFLAGGNKDYALNGIVQTHTFNPATNTWSLGPNMAVGRWYPSVTPLRNGEMLITEGGPDTPEIRTNTGTLRELSAAALNLPLYPWLDVAPDGRTFYSGPDQTMRSLDTAGSGAWQAYGQRDTLNRSYGSRALYDVGKILVSGGAASAADARVIDINGATPTTSATAPMAYRRRQHNLTVLADGTVLATGGNSSGASLVDLANGVYPAEQWNPATGQWKTLAPMQVTRQYHSTALLLPDGRVLSAGGGICGTCDTVGYLAKNAEVFTPPYLYKKDGSGALATRPSIASAPTAVGYGAGFDVSTPEAAAIRKLALVRLGAVTHSVNMEQRYVPLTFTAGTGTLRATSPVNANVAPPGMYMLFAIDANGVPSQARMVTLRQAPTVGLTSPAAGASYTAPATVSLVATAKDADGTVRKVEFFRGTTKLAEDLTAPYTYTWSAVPAGSYSLTARATDDLGATTTSAARGITVRANTPPATSITSPLNGAVFPRKADITIAARATDADGTVRKVEFFRANGATKLGEDLTAPYSYRWYSALSGTHQLRVRATDNGGAVTTSAAVGITVRY